MPRPKKPRFVSGYPTLTAFIPEGVPVTGEISLSVEEFEAVRLSDFEGLDQESAANLMAVSRQTYGRILARARHCISEEFRGRGRGRRRRGGRGKGRGPGRGRGDGRAPGKDRVGSLSKSTILPINDTEGR